MVSSYALLCARASAAATSEGEIPPKSLAWFPDEIEYREVPEDCMFLRVHSEYLRTTTNRNANEASSADVAWSDPLSTKRVKLADGVVEAANRVSADSVPTTTTSSVQQVTGTETIRVRDVSHARNQCIAQTTGDFNPETPLQPKFPGWGHEGWILALDSDDVMHPRRIERLWHAAQQMAKVRLVKDTSLSPREARARARGFWTLEMSLCTPNPQPEIRYRVPRNAKNILDTFPPVLPDAFTTPDTDRLIVSSLVPWCIVEDPNAPVDGSVLLSELVLLGSRFNRAPLGSTPRYTSFLNALQSHELLAYRTRDLTLIQPTWFFNRSAFDRACLGRDWGYPRELSEDLAMFQSWVEHDLCVGKLEEDLVTYRYVQNSASAKVGQQIMLQSRLVHWEKTELGLMPEVITYSKTLDENVWASVLQPKSTSQIKKERQQGLVLNDRGETPEEEKRRTQLEALETFQIWGAGRDGKRVYNLLSDQTKCRISCFADITEGDLETKTSNSQAPPKMYLDPQSSKRIKRNVPILPLSEIKPRFLVCVGLDGTDGELESRLARITRISTPSQSDSEREPLIVGIDYFHMC